MKNRVCILSFGTRLHDSLVAAEEAEASDPTLGVTVADARVHGHCGRVDRQVRGSRPALSGVGRSVGRREYEGLTNGNNSKNDAIKIRKIIYCMDDRDASLFSSKTTPLPI